MMIEITGNKTIGEIRKEFAQQFSFLNLEFYDETHNVQETSNQKHLYPHDKKISDISKRHNSGIIEISPEDKTGIIEQKFRHQFGLNVQVFRHHGNQWIQTAGTDELTLNEQNEIGRMASESMHIPERRIENEKML